VVGGGVAGSQAAINTLNPIVEARKINFWFMISLVKM
jgi:hypothetical protein